MGDSCSQRAKLIDLKMLPRTASFGDINWWWSLQVSRPFDESMIRQTVQNVRVTHRSPKDLGKVLCKRWPQSSVKFAMNIEQRFNIGMETMREKASVQSS